MPGFLSHDNTRNNENNSFCDKTNIAPDMVNSMSWPTWDSCLSNISHVKSHNDKSNDSTKV